MAHHHRSHWSRRSAVHVERTVIAVVLAFWAAVVFAAVCMARAAKRSQEIDFTRPVDEMSSDEIRAAFERLMAN